MTTPRIVSRAEWQASPPRGLLSAPPGPRHTVFIHHSVTRPTSNPGHDARSIQQIGFARGFSDISYSVLAHPDGTLLMGRDWTKVGGHTKGHNSQFAVCLIGDYHLDADTPAPDRPTAAQAEAIAGLFAWWVDTGRLRADFNVRPHRDVSATACPGNQVSDAWIHSLSSLSPERDDDMRDHFIAFNGTGAGFVFRPNGQRTLLTADERGKLVAAGVPDIGAVSETFLSGWQMTPTGPA